MPRPGDVADLTIDKPAAGGRMLARLDGQVVLVSGAIPGERVRVRIEGRRGGVLFGSVADVLEASPDRRPGGDDPACGGRQFAHILPPRQRTLKAEILRDAFRRLARLEIPGEVPVHASPEEGYRMRARLHVQGRVLGFYREGTHELCDAAGTRQLTPATLHVLSAVSRELARSGVSTGRTLELSENRDASQRAILLDLSASGPVAQVDGLLGLPDVTGVGITRSGEPLAAQGSPLVADELTVTSPDGASATVRLQRHVAAFFQGNRFLLETLVNRVLAQLPAGPLTDLYAGVGLFGLAHASLCRGEVVAVEADAASVEDLEANAEPYRDTVRVITEPVEQALARRATTHGRTTIVDPPRTGLSRQALAALSTQRPPAIVYVSCDVATLARDVGALGGAGYGVSGAEIFDLFPGTAHVETVVSLARRD